MKKPLVSVCTITYGHEKFIAETIEGVLMQDIDFSVEFIIADDSSPDQTAKIIQQYIANHPKGHWIKYTKHPINKGMNQNFSWAIEQCNGKYIALCEGDDYWTDDKKLQKQVDFLETNKEFSICFHKVNVIQDAEIVSDCYVESRYPSNKNSEADLLDLLRKDNFIHTPSVVFKNTKEPLPIEFFHSPVGDYLLHVINAENGRIKRFDEKMAVYRKGVGIYSTINKQEKLKKVIMYQACILSYLKNDEAKEIVLNQISQSINKSYAVESLLAKEISFRKLIKLFIIKLRQLMKSNES